MTMTGTGPLRTHSFRRAARAIVAGVTTCAVLLPLPSGAAPAHDDIADAAAVGSLPFELRIDTTGATDEPFEDSLSSDSASCTQHPGVWVKFIPDVEVTVIAVIDGAQRSAAALFEKESEDSLRFIYCMRSLDGRLGSSDGNLHSLEAGKTYYVRLSTAEDEPSGGSFTFLLDVEHGITGRIRDESGTALGGVVVWAHDEERDRVAGACSPSTGRYRVSGLPRGTFRLSFETGACDPHDGDAKATSVPDGYTEWYKNKTSFASATPVEVKATGDTSGIDVVLGQTAPPPSPEETPEPTSSPTGSADPSPSVSPSPSSPPSIGPSPVAARGRRDGKTPLWPFLTGIAVGIALTVWRVMVWRARRGRA